MIRHGSLATTRSLTSMLLVVLVVSLSSSWLIRPTTASFLTVRSSNSGSIDASASASRDVVRKAAIQPGDTVVVVGGTGGVGQLVTKKLLAAASSSSSSGGGGFQVRVTSRDRARGVATMDDDMVDVVELDLIRDPVSKIQTILQGVSGLVISVGTTAFPTAKWSGGNTPDAVDHVAVSKLAQAAAACPSMKRVVLVTSVGVERTGQMPFLVLNLFGVLDAKRKGERAIQEAATTAAAAAGARGPIMDYVIVRPGRLVGGPFTNLDVARLLQIEGGAENGVECEKGDSLLGDCKRDACAEAIVRALQSKKAQNIDFSIISNDSKALTANEWDAVFQNLQK